MSNSIKKLNILVNANLKHLVSWLNANKISLNIKKLRWQSSAKEKEMRQRKFEGDLKIKIYTKRLHLLSIGYSLRYSPKFKTKNTQAVELINDLKTIIGLSNVTYS